LWLELINRRQVSYSPDCRNSNANYYFYHVFIKPSLQAGFGFWKRARAIWLKWNGNWKYKQEKTSEKLTRTNPVRKHVL
jgi:hypothetical protein